VVVHPMAPILLSSSKPQPHVEIRQGPTPYEITLTVTRETATYTSTITLGTEVGTATAAPTNVLATTTAVSTTIQTLAPSPENSSRDNSGVVIGAVFGTIFGLAVLLTLVYKYCFNPQSAVGVPRRRRYDDYSSSYMTDSERSSGSSGRIRRRGGDGDYHKREKRGYRGYRVRRPERAYVRRERRGSVSVDGDSEGRSEWRDEKRSRRRSKGSGGLVIRKGMLGWAFGGGRGRERRDRHGYRNERRGSWVGSETFKMRFTVDD